MQKPSNAQGTKDFGPEVMHKRDFILQSISKQFDYASETGVHHVIVIDESEMQSGSLTLKDLVLGEQENGTIGEIITKLAE